MKPTLNIASGVLAVLLLAELGARLVGPSLPDWRPFPTPESSIKAGQLNATAESVDVVFIGSSVVEAGIDPEIVGDRTGLSSYNAALPFSSPLSNHVWLTDFVIPALDPSVVVISLPVWPYGPARDGDLMLDGLRAVQRVTDQDARLHSELLRRRGQIRNLSETLAARRRERSGAISQFGYQSAYETASGSAGVFEGEPEPVLSDESREALTDTLDQLAAKDIRAMLMIEPIGCPPALGSCPSPDLDAHPAYELANERDLVLIDAAAVQWPVEFYADGAHFNRSGTVALSEFVATALMEHS